MALKSDRFELQTDISFFYNAGTATRGCVVAHGGTAGSGAAMDQGANLAVKSTSAVPIGILLNDVVNKDLTRTHLNQHKDEVQKGGKVTILRKGYVVTNVVMELLLRVMLLLMQLWLRLVMLTHLVLIKLVDSYPEGRRWLRKSRS